MAEVVFGRGVYVTAFHYPVVPMNRARIRCQVSAAHTPEQMAFAVDAFRRAREETAA
jgi:glycine C-acetyltransferase